MVKRARFIGCALAVLLIATSAFATQLLEVDITDRNSASQLLAGGFDVLSIQPPVAQVLAWPGDVERLSTTGLSFRVVQDDLEAFYRSRLDYELDDMGGYPTWSEIREWYDDMLETYPDLISEVDTIGYSLEERPIWAFKISDNPNDDEEELEVFFNAAIHAREVITPLILMNFTEYICDNYDSDAELANLINDREIWMIPVVNPDGYTYNEENDPNGGGMWRKNKRQINNQIMGVDLNRNWPYMWGYDNEGSSPNPSATTYRGVTAGSEPETQAMMDFINAHEFKIIINYHSYSNLILYPYAYDVDELPEDLELYEVLTDTLNETLGWSHGRAPDILYAVNGDATDWQEGACDYNTFGFVFEVGSAQDGFWPATNRIDDLTEAQLAPMMAVLRMASMLESLRIPTAPVVSAPDTVYDDFEVAWLNTDELDLNAPYTFDLQEMMFPFYEDMVNPDTYLNLWDFDGFYVTGDLCYSAPAAYSSGSGANLNNSMTSMNYYHVEDNDTLRFHCIYEIEDGWDYAYVKASTDGVSWVNLAGNITTDEDPNGANLGNGITGFIDEWTEAVFPLNDYTGQDILIRFSYITDTYVNEYGIVIDNVSPVLGFESINLLVSSATDTSWSVEYPDSLAIPETRWYKARTKDAQGQVSEWSTLVATVFDTIPDTTDFVLDEATGLPDEFAVSEAYPNPFNPETSLRVTLPATAQVDVTVFDILGREVYSGIYRKQQAGVMTVALNGTTWSSGFYFARVQMNGDKESHSVWRKLVLLK